ncbi:MAG: 16S rRNA (cytidine(1402)-2'-O)-methyltransferase [Bacteroidota bacterium]
MAGVLYLVATPIGNPEDITMRAVRILKEADIVVYEERREGAKLLHRYGIQDKPVENLNEHNEPAASSIILEKLREGKNVALISDGGTPVFADPGQVLVQRAIAAGIRIVPIPGASSILPALIVSGFPIQSFVFYGFLSPKRNRRITELQQLKRDSRTIVILETPYRLVQLMRDVSEVIGGLRKICVAFDLTLPTEEIFHGTAPHLYAKFQKQGKKGEFVVVLGPG